MKVFIEPSSKPTVAEEILTTIAKKVSTILSKKRI